MFITVKKNHKDTPPMPCNALEAEKELFPFLILFHQLWLKELQTAARWNWLTL